ncbi:MAG: hypothetical protein MAG453_00598 [Calditrichaeota bacterium]|nr:hypothetical protein [Calditrichota bacterium]
MSITGLHLLLSYQCTNECDHCFVYSSPSARGTMSLRFARNAIHQAQDVKGMEEIWFEGGEPFLLYPVLMNAAWYAAMVGFRIGIVTNGYFATTVEDAMEWLRPLVELPEIALSVSEDVYHGSDEGDNPAARTREAARRLGIEADAVSIEQPCGVVIEHEKGEPILGGGVRFRGRAADRLADDPSLPRKPWHEFTECPDEDWDRVGRLHLDGYGNVFACQGVVIGNLDARTLREIVREYEPDTHPIIGPLKRGGPAELVRHYDLPLKGEYLDACQLCFLARRALRERRPDLLAPPVVYGEDPGDASQGEQD